MELIPAIDIIEGKCVRLAKGDFSKKTVYNDNPLEVAKGFEDAGLHRLHIVDLDGAKGLSLTNVSVLESIASNTSLGIDYGGGLKTTDDINAVFNAGAAMVSVGSVTIKDPELFSSWLSKFGPRKFLPGSDVLDNTIRIHGWKEDTGINILDYIEQLIALDIHSIFCTDIAKDGMMQGPSILLYKEILKHFPSLHLIASGGVSCYEDLSHLKEAGCTGAIIGKAFFEGKITMPQIQQFLKL